MPSFRRRASVIDADVDKTPTKSEETAEAGEPADALSLAEEAEAEAAEAEAVAAAARARARAIRLRREAAAATATDDTQTAEDESVTVDEPTGEDTVEDTADGVADEAVADDAVEKEEVRRGSGRLRRPSFWAKLIGTLLCLAATIALIAASVWMFLQHKNQQDDQRRAAEYSAAARQGVVTLMSLDFNNAQEDVQRIIDNTTGQFRDEFQNQAEAFAEVARQSKVITEANVNVAAVQSMDEDSAKVLVSATSHVTNSAGANREPRSWRLLVDLERDGDRVKMSKVEFVP